MLNSSKINSFANTVKGLITSHNNDSSAHSSLFNGKENISNKVTNISSSSTNQQYPTAKCIYDIIGDVEGATPLFYTSQTYGSAGEITLNRLGYSMDEDILFYDKGYGVLEDELVTKREVMGFLSANKVNSWSPTTSNNNVPSEKLVKDSLDEKVDSSDLTDYVQKSSTTGLLKNDGTIDTNSYSLSTHNHTGTYAPISHTQTSSTITDVEPINVVVTFDDETTQTLTLLKKTT